MISRTRKIIDKDKLEEIENIIGENLNILDYMKENGLETCDDEKMPCFLHEDFSPSLFVNKDKNIWKCHSCGRGGGYILLVMHHSNIIKGNKMNYYETIEYILRTHPEIQAYFSGSLYRMENVIKNIELNTDALKQILDSNNFKVKEYDLKTNKKVQAEVYRKKSIEDKIRFIISLQEKLPVNYIGNVNLNGNEDVVKISAAIRLEDLT